MFDDVMNEHLCCSDASVTLGDDGRRLFAGTSNRRIVFSKKNDCDNDYAGPRLSIALHCGVARTETNPMTGIEPNEKITPITPTRRRFVCSGRLDYFGDVTAAAGEIEAIAHPGQVRRSPALLRFDVA